MTQWLLQASALGAVASATTGDSQLQEIHIFSAVGSGLAAADVGVSNGDILAAIAALTTAASDPALKAQVSSFTQDAYAVLSSYIASTLGVQNGSSSENFGVVYADNNTSYQIGLAPAQELATASGFVCTEENTGGSPLPVLSAYIPTTTAPDVFSSTSGLTVLCGFDLAQHTAAQALNDGFTQSQVNQWSEFFAKQNADGSITPGPIGSLANEDYVSAIQANGNRLTFTATQGNEVNNNVISSYLNNASTWYNEGHNGLQPPNTFQSLPENTQIAITDLLLKGNLDPTYTIVNEIISNNWGSVVNNLGFWNRENGSLSPADSHFFADQQLILKDLIAPNSILLGH